ncbi:MAG: glycoside hydrolase family 1 protein, partial [Oscillospiraceae bacterium]
MWDAFCKVPGHVFENENGSVACDGYHRYREDIRLAAEMGLKAYRFGVSWARVDPSGTGRWNEEGLAYYDKVVNACLEAGLTPYVTLYHWELPQALEEKGGWQVRQTAECFARYAAVVAARFKGRVGHYFTLNEPQCSVYLGYATGEHAPGKRLAQAEQFWCMHHLLLAHGLAFRAIRAQDGAAQISLATTGRLCYPETQTPPDIQAARSATFALFDNDWAFTHHLFLDPVVHGGYPRCEGTFLAPLVDAAPPQDMEVIHTGLDFLSLNIYNGHAVRRGKAGKEEYVPRYTGFPRTALKWPVTPEVMNWGVHYMYQRYNLRVFITENGLSCNDKVFLDGGVHDPDR